MSNDPPPSPIEFPLPYEDVKRLVCHTAIQTYMKFGKKIDLEDLEAEAWLIAVECAKNYDAGRGSKFSNYLVTYIKLKLMTASIRNGIQPLIGSRRNAQFANAGNTLSLSAVLSSKDYLTIESTIGREDELTAMSEEKDHRENQINKLLKCLNERQKDILIGLASGEVSSEELAAKYGVGTSHIYGISIRAMRMVRRKNNIQI
jgi:RNA polymerase sigma factor (sigma-70 family)